MEIPNIWLVGRCSMLEKEGLAPLEALQEAVRQWMEQKRLEEDFNGQS